MAVNISPLSVVQPGAELDNDVEIGPFCLVGPNVRIGAGTVLRSHVTLAGHTTIGRDNQIFANCVIGEEPQDISYQGSPTRVEIGDRNTFREGVTVHRGAEKEDQLTRIGDGCYFMATSHVAHNCILGSGIIVGNATMFGGHVHIQDYAVISGNCVVHHFCSIGTMSFIGGASRVTRDVPPYLLAVGCDEFEVSSVNLVGIQRRGIDRGVIALLRRAHKLMYREFKSVSAVREIFTAELGVELPFELRNLLDFVTEQDLGKNGRGRERSRDVEQRRAA